MKTVNLLLSGKKGLITLERLVENDINLPQIHNVVIGIYENLPYLKIVK